MPYRNVYDDPDRGNRKLWRDLNRDDPEKDPRLIKQLYESQMMTREEARARKETLYKMQERIENAKKLNRGIK